MSVLALIRVQWKAGRVVDAMKSLLAGNQRKGGIKGVISLALESVLPGIFLVFGGEIEDSCPGFSDDIDGVSAKSLAKGR